MKEINSNPIENFADNVIWPLKVKIVGIILLAVFLFIAILVLMGAGIYFRETVETSDFILGLVMVLMIGSVFYPLAYFIVCTLRDLRTERKKFWDK